MALIVLFMNRAVFSHWTEEGLLYVKQWQALRKYLTDFTLLSQNPPQALAMWDELLVYGTALGVAKQTLKNLRQLYPTAPPETPVAGTLYVRPFIVDKLNGMPTTALLSMGGGKSGIRGGGGLALELVWVGCRRKFCGSWLNSFFHEAALGNSTIL